MFGNLRLVRTDKFSEYQGNTELFLRLGNEDFGAAMRAGIPQPAANQYHAPWLLYHSWRKGRIQIDEHSAALIRELMAGAATGPQHADIIEKIRAMGWCDDHLPVDLDELVQRTQDFILAIQNDYELVRFLALVREQRPRVVVEIGTARGGMLYCFSQLAARDATLVSIDLPGAPNCGGQTATEREVFATFGPVTQTFHFIPEDSHLESSREKLLKILRGRTIDLLFIDGDHSYEGCLADFHMYRHLVSPDGRIAFHDILLFPDQWPGAGVGLAWQDVKAQFGGEEIIDPEGVSTIALEPGQRWHWGIGLLDARRLKSPHLNPSLCVDAYFQVPFADEVRKTIFRLRDHPEIAAWLQSFLDFVIGGQEKVPGQAQGQPRLAEPPAGDTRERLIRGGAILAEQRADGGPALRLNPTLEVYLYLTARRRNGPAHTATLGLAEDPALTRWLLTHNPNSTRPQDPTQLIDGLSEALLASLRRHQVLVDELPAGETCFPDPAAPLDLAAELATASRVFSQPAGQPVPASVRQILGRQTPILPRNTGLLWGEDAGTGLVFPTCWPPDLSPGDLQSITGTEAPRRKAQWDRQRETARRSLLTRRYAVLRDIVPAAQQTKLRLHVRELVDRGYFPELGDGQVDLRSGIHNQPTIAALHNGLAGVVSSLCGEPVIASYSYLSYYAAGSVLARHKDRPQCAYNLSLVLDMTGPQGEPDPWPIYVEIDGRPEPVLLQVGDGVAYSGTELWHWREALPAGQRAIVCFFHFVPRDFKGSLD